MTTAHSDNQRTKRYFFLLGGVFIEPTAIEIQACVRAQLFKEYFNITPTIISHGHHPYRKHNLKEHLRANNMADDIPIYSLFDVFCDKQLPAAENNNQEFLHQKNMRYGANTSDLSSVQAFISNELQMHIAYHKDTRLVDYVNYIEHGMVTKRDSYDEQGYLSMAGVVDEYNNDTVQHFLDRNGRHRVTVTVHNQTVNNVPVITKAFAYNTHGMVSDVFNSREEFVAAGLQRIADQYANDELYFIIEHPIFYQGLRKLEHPHTHIASVFHAMQTVNPDVANAAFHTHFADTLADCHTQQSLQTIVLTEQQKNDIEKRLGTTKNIHVIPNALQHETKEIPFVERDRFLVTALVRLNPTKQVDKMIDMFALVHRAVPKARLEIYGVGELAPLLQEHINAQGLQDTVILKGFVQNPYTVFAKAGISIITSVSEALPLVIMESLVSGCPFVGFDIKYGPAAMVNDGENGYLVPANDIEAMADKIIHLLNDPQLHEYMCNNAFHGEKHFSRDNVAREWQKLLKL